MVLFQSSSEYTTGVHSVAGLAGLIQLLEAEKDKRNWSWRELAAEAKISESTLSKWRKNPARQPDLESLALLSIALELPLRQLILACGFPLEESGAYQNQSARVQAILEAVPQLQPMMEYVSRLKETDRDDVLQYIEYRVRKSRG